MRGSACTLALFLNIVPAAAAKCSSTAQQDGALDSGVPHLGHADIYPVHAALARAVDASLDGVAHHLRGHSSHSRGLAPGHIPLFAVLPGFAGAVPPGRGGQAVLFTAVSCAQAAADAAAGWLVLQAAS